MSGGPVLIVSPATTAGWRANEEGLTGSLSRLGVDHVVRRIRLGSSGHLRRTGWWPLVDAVEAAAALRALRSGLRHDRPAAVVLLSSTAALLAPVARLRAGGLEVAVRLDCPSAVLRPGPQNAAQRALERRRLGDATIALATGPRSAELVAPLARRVAELPVGLEALPAATRQSAPIDVVTYIDDPLNKGLDLVCRAWESARAAPGGTLHVTGVDSDRGRRFLRRTGVAEPPGLRWHGQLPRERHLELVRSAAAYVSASDWEGHGIAQLEALAGGVPLVTTPSRGAYEAEPIARALSPELVTSTRDAGELGRALAIALAMPAERRSEYARRAAAALEPFSGDAADRAMRDEILPALLPGTKRR